MAQVQVFSLSELAKSEGLTRNGLEYYIRIHDADHCRAGSGRIFFTFDQAQAIKALRTARLSKRAKRQGQ